MYSVKGRVLRIGDFPACPSDCANCQCPARGSCSRLAGWVFDCRGNVPTFQECIGGCRIAGHTVSELRRMWLRGHRN